MTKCPKCHQSLDRPSRLCPFCGAWLDQDDEFTGADTSRNAGAKASDLDPEQLKEQIRVLLEQDQKISAIKLYRDVTGAGLADAKNAVEALEESRQLQVEPSLEAELLALLARSEKIGAIKLYRERLGASLLEAKNAVEALERNSRAEGDSPLETELLALLQRGEKIAAIRHYRTKTGKDLRASKEAVEALARLHGISPRSQGCAGIVVSILLVGAVLSALAAS